MPRFSATVMNHFQEPRNQGRLDTPDRVGIAGVPGQGRFLILHLNITAGCVVDARFQCHGCGATIAAGSMLTELVVGQTVKHCREISASALLDALEGLPADKRHCAGFAVNALQQALEDIPND